MRHVFRYSLVTGYNPLITIVIPLWGIYLALGNTIANSLIGALYSMQKEWRPLIDIPPKIESELMVFARKTPTNTSDFSDYLLGHRQRFRECVMLQATLDIVGDEVGKLMNRRFEIRSNKEKAVNEGRYK